MLMRFVEIVCKTHVVVLTVFVKDNIQLIDGLCGYSRVVKGVAEWLRAWPSG